MDYPDNPYDELEPLFHGLPVLVRLITGDDILCILFQRTESPSNEQHDTRLYMERPLRLYMQETEPDSAAPTSPVRERTIMSTVRTRFDRWMPFTAALVYPIYPDHILSIAPISDQYTNSYIGWADQLYEELPHASPVNSTKDQTDEEIRRSYLDFLLHQFTPKGKPN